MRLLRSKKMGQVNKILIGSLEIPSDYCIISLVKSYTVYDLTLYKLNLYWSNERVTRSSNGAVMNENNESRMPILDKRSTLVYSFTYGCGIYKTSEEQP